MKISYMLEIYEPNSQDTQICNAFSDSPFPRFEKGDLLRATGKIDDQKLIVDYVTYLVSDISVFTIKTMVFTKLQFPT